MAEDQSGAVAALGALRDELARHPELRSYRQVVQDVARQVAASDGHRDNDAKAADGWADLDLIAALGVGAPAPMAVTAPHPAPVAVAEPGKPPRWRTAIEALPPVLVFVPILLTWLSLFAASSAYRSLEASAPARTANAGKSFLELWQQGFGGRLPALLSFGYVAMYTVVAVTLLIVMTALGGHFRRRDEEAQETAERTAEQARAAAHATAERARVTAEQKHAAAEQARVALLPALARAQAELNKHRLGTPVRFAAELSQAAIELRQLLEHTDHTQDSALKLAQQNQALSQKLAQYATDMREATGELQSAATLMRTAADALAQANAVLGSEVSDRVEASTGRLDEVTGQAAARVGELVQVGQSSLDGITDRFDSAMAGVRTQVTATIAAMINAGDRYSTAIGESSSKAAAEIGEAYEEAIATAAENLQEALAAVAVSLASEMARSNGELSEILDAVGQGADTQRAAALRTEEAVKTQAEAMTTAAERISGAAQDVSGAAATFSGAVNGISGVAADISSVAADVSDVAERIAVTAERICGAADGVSGAAVGVADSSGTLERAVTGYTSVQQQVADTLGQAADRLSAHAASLAAQLAAASTARADSGRAEEAARADDDLVPDAELAAAEAADTAEPAAATELAATEPAATEPGRQADLTGTEESP